ncbi:MAG TPA: hypothetical protein VF677_10125 [Flavobacterium sp.]|jgi:hypothetical protein
MKNKTMGTLAMKKIIVMLLFLFCNSIGAQTLLASQDISLKKPASEQQFLAFTNTNNNVIVAIASDKEKIVASKYNSAVFFKDSLLIKKPEKKFKFIAGYHFNDDQNPTLYYCTEDYKNIQGITIDFAAKTSANTFFTLPTIDKELFLNSFTENNTFYILTATAAKSELKLYVFQNNKLETKTLDLSRFEWRYNNRKTTLSDLITENPFTRIDNDMPNTIHTAVAKSKLYTTDSTIVITFDHNVSQTQAYSINLNTFEITENIIPQPNLQKAGISNSFYRDKKLFQLKLNNQQMVFTIKDFASGTGIKTFTASEKDTVAFKNSPFFSQNGTQRSVIIKDTQRFLRKAATSDVGISVYKHKKHYLVTIGGSTWTASTGGILLGIVDGILNDGDVSGITSDQVLQTVYFESVFDDDFNPKKLIQLPLAADGISDFLNFNDDPKGINVFKFKDFHILGYYDPKAKQYIMRKFQDGVWY